MALKNRKDHWAFLEEIEAPMWVDLTLEAKSIYQEIDDDWFHTTHVFHQCSSHQLKAAFAHSDEGSMSSDIDMKGPSSPKLPTSVSRSRGKHYENNKSSGVDHDLSLNKQHPVKFLNGKSSRVNSGSGEEMKPKISFTNSKGISRSKRSFVLEKDLTEVKENDLKAVCSHGDSKGSLSSEEDKAGESNTSESDQKPSNTSESDQKPKQRNLEVPSRTFGYSNGLISAMRISLRKSCGTRQASRMDFNNIRRQSRGCNSGSSKSSVGSSLKSNSGYDVKSSTFTLMQHRECTRQASRVDFNNIRRQSRGCNSGSNKSSVGSSSNSNSGYDVKSSTFALMQHRECTPDSRNLGKITRAAKNKVKDSFVSKASNVQAKEGVYNSRRGGADIVSKPSYQELAKSKVQNQTARAKGLLPHRVNEQGLLTGAAKAKEKVTVAGPKLVGAGNENATGKVPVSQKFSRGDIGTGVVAQGQKGAKQNVPRKGDRSRLVSSKEKMGSPRRGKHPINATQRVYLR